MSPAKPCLYFAYAALLEPARLRAVAPDAAFLKVAHLQETRLYFARGSDAWDGALPTIRPEEGHTVWGALFEVGADDLAAITAAEAADGRVPTEAFSVVDREGHRHHMTTHVVPGPEDGAPSRSYLRAVVAGGQHWRLPTGWVLGLEELTEDRVL